MEPFTMGLISQNCKAPEYVTESTACKPQIIWKSVGPNVISLGPTFYVLAEETPRHQTRLSGQRQQAGQRPGVSRRGA